MKASEPPATQGRLLFQSLCVQCHGEKGNGSEALQAPAIASQPDWYVLNQFQHFAEGRRGTADDGPQALVMAAMIKILSQPQRTAIAAYVESLPRTPPPPEPKSIVAEIAEGKMLFEDRCMECHRYNAAGERVFGSPPLIGLQGWYLRTQLHRFKTGKRGAASPSDANGQKMSQASRYAETEQDVENLIAYVLSLNQSPSSNDTTDNPFDVNAASPRSR